MHFKMIDASLQVYVIFLFFFLNRTDAMCGVSTGNTVVIFVSPIKLH